MPNPKPAPLNVIPEDPTGETWALPEDAIARFGKGVYGSSPSLDSIALSPDGTYFAAGTGMGLWWYDVASMSPIALWETERGMISDVAISHDGNLVSIANWDGIIKVFDIKSGNLITQMKLYKKFSFVKFLTFSPDCQCVSTSPSHEGIDVLNIYQSKRISQMKIEPINGKFNITSGVSFSPDGNYIATTETATHSDNGGYIPLLNESQTAVWDPKTSELIAKFPSSKFVFSPDSRLLACACPDNTDIDSDDKHHRFISVLDTMTGERIAHCAGHEHWINAITFSPCGHLIASADKGGNLRVWELEKGTLKDQWKHNGIDSELWNMNHWDTKWGMSEFTLTRLVPFYSPQGKLFTVVFPDKTDTVEVWDVTRRKRIKSLERISGSIGAKWVAKCPELALAWTSLKKTTTTGKANSWGRLREHTFGHRTRMGRGQDNDSIWFTTDGQTIVSDSDGGGVVLWDIRPKPQRFIEKLRSSIQRIRYSDSARKQEYNTLLSMQATEKLQAQDTLKKDPNFSSIDWHNITMSKEWHTMSVSQSGKKIALGAYGEILIWCTEKLATIKTIQLPEKEDRRYVLAFSPCDRYLISGTWWQKGMEKMAIRLWDVATGENIHTFWGHNTDIQSLAFSPDGKLLASCSYDHTILLWDIKPFIDM